MEQNIWVPFTWVGASGTWEDAPGGDTKGIDRDPPKKIVTYLGWGPGRFLAVIAAGTGSETAPRGHGG